MLAQLCHDYDALIKKKDIYRKHQPYKLHRETILRCLNDDMPIDVKLTDFYMYILRCGSRKTECRTYFSNIIVKTKIVILFLHKLPCNDCKK